MNSSAFYTKFFKSVYFTGDALSYPSTERALAALSGLPVKRISTKAGIPAADLHRHTLFITTSKGRSVNACPGSRGHICCNYLTVDLYSGCMLDCSYCIMQGYLNFAPITVYVDTDRALDSIDKIIRGNPGATIRIGSGEVGDSLALDPLFGLSRDFIEALAGQSRVFFELKTKTHFIDHLLDINPKGKAVIAFSLNPEQIIASEEAGASPLAQRLKAAVKAVAAGYLVAVHFDPIIFFRGWEKLYSETVAKLAALDCKKIAWISLGTLRFTKALRERMRERSYLYEEFVPCADGKFRYLLPVRSRMYASMREWIEGLGRIPVYLCMESGQVWQNVFGKLPGKNHDLCAIFTRIKRVIS